MTSPALARNTSNGRYYTHPVTGAEDYASVTNIIGKGVAKPWLATWKLKLAAEYAVDNLDQLKAVERNIAIAAIKAQGDYVRNKAGDVGTFIHDLIDTGAISDPVACKAAAMLECPEAVEFIEPTAAFIDDWRPQEMWSEVTVFSDKYRFAGTLDSLQMTPMGLAILDYKTGKSISNDVALQLSALANADYAWIAGEQVPIPAVDLGLVVHLRPEGYAVHQVDIGAPVFEAFLACLTIGAHNASNDVVSPKLERPSVDQLQARRRRIEQRLRGIIERGDASKVADWWPAGVPTLKQSDGHSHEQLDLIEALLVDVDEKAEGAFVSKIEVERLEGVVESFPLDLQQWVTMEAKALGLPHVKSGMFNAVHLGMLEGLAAEAATKWGVRVDAAKAATVEAFGDDDPEVVGAAMAAVGLDADTELAALTASGAEKLALICRAARYGYVSLHFDTDGVASLRTDSRYVVLMGGKGAVLDAGRKAAKANGWASPKSAAAVADDVGLATAAASLAGKFDEAQKLVSV